MPDIRETGKIYCIEDAHTRTNSAYNEHDEAINIASVAVGRHSQGYQCYGFFKFDEHNIPDNAVIVSAAFGGRVYNRLLASVSTMTARPCGGAWEDTVITYRTMPTSVGVSDSVGIGDEGSYFSADITAIAQAWFGGGYNYEDGLYVTSSAASSYKRVYSHTAADNNKPYIEITYYVPASKPTTDKTSLEIAADATLVITTNRLSSEYKHTLSWSLGSKTGTIADNVADSYTWTLTDADVSALLAALPAAESGTLKIVCETFDAAGKSLGTEYAVLTVTVPASVRPKISGINITGLDLGKGVYYLSGVSRMQVDVTAAPGAGSTLASVIVTVDGKKYSGTSITTDVLTGSGRVGANVTVTDARGRTVSGGASSTIPVYNYAAPAINAFAIERCNEDGSAVQIDGEYLRFTLDASASLIAMPSVNQVTAEIYTKLRSASEWTLVGSYNHQTNVLKLENAVLPGTYSPLSSYDILMRLTDSMGTSADRLTVITTATSLQHYDPYHTRVTFGRIGERTDPEHALITALDLIAEAGVSLHGADVADGQIDLPDGGMIAASAGFELAQDNAGAIRTLESVTVTAESESGTQTLSCDLGGPACEAEVDFAAGKWVKNWQYLALTGAEDWTGYKGTSGNWIAWMRPQLPAVYTPAAETGNAVCNLLPAVSAENISASAAGGITTVYNDPIVLTAQPADISVPVDGLLAFSVVADGEGLTYQWEYRQGQNGGWMDSSSNYAKTADFKFNPAKNYHNGYQYRCKITDANGNKLVSDYGTVTIVADNAPAILIAGDPDDQNVRVGMVAKFSVVAQGEGLTYQWEYRRGQSGGWMNSTTSGNKTPQIAISTMAYQNGYQYRCAVTDASGNTVTSGIATLHIGEKEGEPADLMLSIPGVTSESAFLAYLADQHAAGTPVTVAYKLATPIEHAIAPQLIAAPAGSCTITTNADTLTAHAAGGRIFYTIAQAINALGRT